MTEAPKLDDATAIRLGHIFAELAHHPKTRKPIAQAVRVAKPDSPEARSFSDVDQEERFESFKAEQEQRELERQREKLLERQETQRRRLLTGGTDGEGRKYSEEDVGKITALMNVKGITDYDDGAVLYAATLPPEHHKPQDIPDVNGTTWEFPEWDRFAKDEKKASRQVANQVISELMRARR